MQRSTGPDAAGPVSTGLGSTGLVPTGPVSTGPADDGSRERDELRHSVRAFLRHHATEAATRALVDTGSEPDPRVWRRVADELGLPALGLPARYGGVGGAAELGVALEECGAALLMAPLLPTAIASAALVTSADTASCTLLLPDLATGRRIGAVALDGAVHARPAPRTADGWQLHGDASPVVDGATADLLLVAAQHDDGEALYAVSAPTPGLTVHALATLDLTRAQARIHLDAASARRVGDADGTALLQRVRDRASVLLAAEQTGGAARVLEQAAAYARERRQFGRAIGSFQAIKHKLADMLVLVESARSAAGAALAAVDREDPELPLVASLAKAYCSDAYLAVARENLQIHGGVGFTWEHGAHLHLKRAHSSRQLFGSPDRHRERMAELFGSAPATT